MNNDIKYYTQKNNFYKVYYGLIKFISNYPTQTRTIVCMSK